VDAVLWHVGRLCKYWDNDFASTRETDTYYEELQFELSRTFVPICVDPGRVSHMDSPLVEPEEAPPLAYSPD